MGEPAAVVTENALRKARAVVGELVLAADTEVVLDGRIYGKPADVAEAERFLRELSGATHEVVSGVALIEEGEELTAVATTAVAFRALDEPTLRWYLDSGEWRGARRRLRDPGPWRGPRRADRRRLSERRRPAARYPA